MHEARIIRDAEVADPGIVRRANEAQTRDRGTNGPALTGKMMHRAVAPGPGYSAAIATPGSRQGAVRSPPPRRAAPSSPAGHGQVPNASMDARSMSTTITFRSDSAGLRSHWSPAAWTTLLPASQRPGRADATRYPRRQSRGTGQSGRTSQGGREGPHRLGCVISADAARDRPRPVNVV
jgi:hypothetical protein